MAPGAYTAHDVVAKRFDIAGLERVMAGRAQQGREPDHAIAVVGDGNGARGQVISEGFLFGVHDGELHGAGLSAPVLD